MAEGRTSDPHRLSSEMSEKEESVTYEEHIRGTGRLSNKRLPCRALRVHSLQRRPLERGNHTANQASRQCSKQAILEDARKKGHMALDQGERSNSASARPRVGWLYRLSSGIAMTAQSRSPRAKWAETVHTA